MCSLFSQSQRMSKDHGDLADIVRASGGAAASGSGDHQQAIPDWDFPAAMEEPIENFGDPFVNMQDPLLHELDMRSPSFFAKRTMDVADNSHLLPRTIFNEDVRRPTNNIFSRMLQISPNSNMSTSSTSSTVMASPRVAAPSKSSSNESVGMMQISSPRNPGVKRRKSQAKKVVCIPAPAAANSSRPSGEVVPSDLWAWRKYGQKPIKGSPYPRGYYRCSSSKGCSARKQVERSRTDPNMLVITYTSEHNHPWPTQRNALAGSTRSQPPKSNAASKSTSSPQTSSKLMNMKEEQIESMHESRSITVVDGSVNVTHGCIKEEADIGDLHEKITGMDDDDNKGHDFTHFHQNYRPLADLEPNLQPDDFFADLGELEDDPLNLLFTESGGNNKALDPFSLFDWAGNNNMFGEHKRGGSGS